MAEINLDLVQAFETAFGAKPNQFQPDFNAVTGDAPVSGRAESGIAGQAAYYGKNPLSGAEYFMPGFIKFPDDNKQMQTWELPFPIMGVTGKKTVIETPLTGRRGTVKELIQIKDYVITCRGLIINGTNEFPEQLVIQLKKLFETNLALKLIHPITDIFLLDTTRHGSDQVVITDLSFPEVKGIKNVRPYELTMVSDAPFSLVSIT